MKVAIVSSVAIFPTTSGNRARIRQLATALREMGHDVSFVHLPVRSQEIDHLAHEREFGKGKYHALTNGGALGEFLQYLRAKLPSIARNALQAMGYRGFYYTPLDGTYNPHWTSKISDAVGDADVAIVEYVFNTLAFDAFPPGTLRLLDTHDAFSNRHERYLAQGLNTGYWISLKPPCEVAGFRRAHTVIAIQEEEADLFREQLESHKESKPSVRVVSHIVDLSLPLDDYSEDHSALFLASDTPANKQALDSFVRHVLPQVVARSPDFVLSVAGSICRRVQSSPHVRKLGLIDDVRAAFSASPVSLSPMLSGTGIAIKVLEAMALGVPTISTDTGARGLREQFRNGILSVRDRDHDGFAHAVLELTTSPGKRRELGLAALADAARWNSIQAEQLSLCLPTRGRSTNLG